MAERPKLLYIIVQDDVSNSAEKDKNHSLSFRYTRSVLQSTLQFIGCKARHAFKISRRVFDILTERSLKSQDRNGSAAAEILKHDYSRHLSDSEIDSARDFSPEDIKKAAEKTDIKLKEITKKLYDVQKKRSTIVLRRDQFMDVVCDAMTEYRYFGPNQRNDFALACKIREKKMSVTVLLCGTSGCGKSTLSTLLASRLGITTVVSTDSIRHMMRSFADEKQNPLLWASTYSAGEHLDPKAVAEAKAKKKAKKIARKYSSQDNQQVPRTPLPENVVSQQGNGQSPRSEVDVKGKAPILVNDGKHVIGSAEVTVSAKTMAIEGYKAQSEMVIDSLDRLITSWEQKCESVIVEGVHLSLDFVMGLMRKHPSIIPFMIYIANEEKHMERFAVRAKYMTLDPAKNKYVKYIRNIRAIQDYQCKRADKYLIPKVNNTNMDQSVASIHATIFACMRRRQGGEPFHDEAGNSVKMVDDEYKNQCAAHTLGSKGMLQIIRRRGSSRQLMALMNTDGSVAKAWAFESSDIGRKLPIAYEEDVTSSKNNEDNNSSPMYIYEGLEVSPVNLQFGNFGLSAWPNDMGCTSYSGSMDGVSSSKGDAFDYQSSHRSSRIGSSCSSSPRLNEGTEKELVFDESAASGSDEEPEEEMVDLDSEEDLNNERDQQLEEEVEGSVADQSGSEEEDEYNGADNETEENETVHQPMDSFGRTRNTYRYSLENGYEVSKVFKEQDLNCGIQQGSFISDFKGSESYVKHLHGRSKSLPLTASYGSY